MKKSKFTEQHIEFTPKLAEDGPPVPDIARKLGYGDVSSTAGRRSSAAQAA